MFRSTTADALAAQTDVVSRLGGGSGSAPNTSPRHAISPSMSIFLKRAYEQPAKSDGIRILVDRLWPRGLAKSKGQIDHWLKDLAPSTELRQWFGHDPSKWAEFQRKYRNELPGNPALSQLRSLSLQGDITLVFASRDELHNDAVVLKHILEDGA